MVKAQGHLRRWGRRLMPWLLLCIATVEVTASAGDALSPLRRLQVNDLLAMERGAVDSLYVHSALARDGALAFVRQRPLAQGRGIPNPIFGYDASDIWVQMDRSSPPVRVTDGAADGSVWVLPVWSPNGERLAMLGTRGGNSFVWTWERKTGRMQQVTSRGVVIFQRGFWWLDEQRLLVSLLPPGERNRWLREDAIEAAPHAWARARAGAEATSSVLESGVSIETKDQPQGQLATIDVVSGATRALAAGDIDGLLLAPNRRSLAYFRKLSAPAPQADQPLTFSVAASATRYALEVVDLQDKSLLPVLSRSTDVVLTSARWSTDGGSLAFLSYGATRGDPLKLQVARLADGKLRSIALSELNPLPYNEGQRAGLEWTAGGELMLLASERVADQPAKPQARRDWWRIRLDGARRCLTNSPAKAPGMEYPRGLLRLPGGQSFVGVADGEVWRIDAKTNRLTNLTERLQSRVLRRAWPLSLTSAGTETVSIEANPVYSRMVLSTEAAANSAAYHMLDLHSGHTTPLASPHAEAVLGAFWPKTGDALFYANTRNGSFVWRTETVTGKSTELISANAFLRGIAAGRFEPLEYTGLGGETLKAWILLPPDYRAGARYPLLTWVYPGQGETIPESFQLGSNHPLNMQLAAARGYAVLLPSMPLEAKGSAHDPLMSLQNGVLPAVDKAIAAGFADPKRLFVAGHSYGGYATYGLIVETSRFKAAIALAGFANWISTYGQFEALDRYSSWAHEFMFHAKYAETGDGGLGSPYWRDLGRYLRNSPLMYIDRVQTPVLIVQGDMDYVSIAQGEEVFTALYRQGKRAQFLRYWGEGHLIRSPANVRDLWTRMLAWLEEFADVDQDAEGNLIFDAEQVRSRNDDLDAYPIDMPVTSAQ